MVTTGLCKLKEEVKKDKIFNARRTSDDDWRRPNTIGYLSDSADPKKKKKN